MSEREKLRAWAERVCAWLDVQIEISVAGECEFAVDEPKIAAWYAGYGDVMRHLATDGRAALAKDGDL